MIKPATGLLLIFKIVLELTNFTRFFFLAFDLLHELFMHSYIINRFLLLHCMRNSQKAVCG